jgi:hypothetical protein
MATIPVLPNTRTLVDTNFVATVAVPAAGSTATTTPFDLVQAYCTSELFNVEIDIPAMPNLTNTSVSATVQLQHCATVGGSYVNIPELAATTVVGVASTGTAAVVDTQKLPPTTLEFVQALVTVPANGGNNTAQTVTVQLKF